MITYIRFKFPVTIGGATDEWAHDRPHVTANAGKITPRAGIPDLGEFRDSIVFEVRVGVPAAWHDVEVPRGNIAHIIRTAPPKSEPKQEGKKT